MPNQAKIGQLLRVQAMKNMIHYFITKYVKNVVRLDSIHTENILTQFISQVN